MTSNASSTPSPPLHVTAQQRVCGVDVPRLLAERVPSTLGLDLAAGPRRAPVRPAGPVPQSGYTSLVEPISPP